MDEDQSSLDNVSDRTYGKVIVIPDPLRDQFACAALTGIIAGSSGTTDAHLPIFAEIAYKIADQMLEARKK